MLTHDEILELIPLTALDAVSEVEAQEVKEHCAGCPTCGSILSDYGYVALGLSEGVPQREPPARLASALRARVAPAQSRRFAWASLFRLPAGFSPGMAVAAVVFVLLAGLGIWRFTAPPADTDAIEVARLQRSTEAVKASIKGTDRAPSSTGQVLADPQATVGYLVVSQLNVLPAEQVYQVWLIRSGQRDSGGTFTVDAQGSARVRLQGTVAFASYSDVGVTVEPKGGSPGPTSAKVIGGSFIPPGR
ncbi:MAG: anti-sigma factor [Chloroflexi bacterium]|nr:anti-sigma factor [Chloroflexota bacterium]